MSEPTKHMATVVGKTCPFCQTPIQRDEPVVLCSACEMPHHRECWQENGRCTTFGCPGDPVEEPDKQEAPARPAPQMMRGGYALCPVCGYAMTAFDRECPRCAKARRQSAPVPQISVAHITLADALPLPSPSKEQPVVIDFDDDELPAECPLELRRWNWGAFTVTPLWTKAMHQWHWYALSFIPVAGSFVKFVAAIKGNEAAWKSRHWESVAHFQATQRAWNRWGIALFVLQLILVVVLVVAAINNDWLSLLTEHLQRLLEPNYS